MLFLISAIQSDLLLPISRYHHEQMSSTDESSYIDTSSDGPSNVTVAKAAFVLLKGLMSQQMPEVNPPCPIPKLSGA